MQGRIKLPRLASAAPAGAAGQAPAHRQQFSDQEIVHTEADPDQWATPPPATREVLYHLPVGYTSKSGAAAHVREALLERSWHCGVARYLLAIILATFVTRP